jgi:hypothetical protein
MDPSRVAPSSIAPSSVNSTVAVYAMFIATRILEAMLLDFRPNGRRAAQPGDASATPESRLLTMTIPTERATWRRLPAPCTSSSYKPPPDGDGEI